MAETLIAPTLLLWRLLDFYLFIALGAYLFLHQLQQTHPQGPSAVHSERSGGPQ